MLVAWPKQGRAAHTELVSLFAQMRVSQQCSQRRWVADTTVSLKPAPHDALNPTRWLCRALPLARRRHRPPAVAPTLRAETAHPVS